MRLFLTTFLCLVQQVESQYDGTALPGAHGQAVTQAAVRAVQDSCIFSNDRQLLRRLAWVATSFGDDPTTFVNHIDGLWRLSEAAFNRTKDPSWFNGRYGQILADIENKLGIDYQKLNWRNGDLLKPIDAAIAERMYIESLNQAIPYQVELQARMWLQDFATGKNVSEQMFINEVALMPNVCQSVGADVLFLMDSSGSITAVNWRIMQNFVIAVVDQFPIGENSYKFAVDVFNNAAESLIPFNGYTNISVLQRLIDVLPYVQGDTRTDLALVNAVTRSFTPRSGMRDASQGFARVAILITDGLSTFPDRTKIAADIAKQMGIVLITIGIANADVEELTYIASEPKCMRTFIMDNFGALIEGFPAELMAQTCQANAFLTEGASQIGGQLDKDQYLYFYTQVNSTTGITYRVNLTEGAVTVYLSTTLPQPDQVRYDFVFNATVDADGELYIGPEQLLRGIDPSLIDQVINAQNWTLVPLYASVRGTDDHNNFTLSVDQQGQQGQEGQQSQEGQQGQQGQQGKQSQSTTVNMQLTSSSPQIIVQASTSPTAVIIAVVAGIILIGVIVSGVLIYYMRYVRYTVNPNENDQQ